MSEIWKPVKGYEGLYEVSNKARVRSLRLDKVLRQNRNSNGYMLVGVSLNGKGKKKRVHRLVAEAFLDNPEEYKIVHHKDGDKENNLPENLEWTTSSRNNKLAIDDGLRTPARGVRNGKIKLTYEQAEEIRYLYRTTEMSQRDLGKLYGVVHSTIGTIVRDVTYQKEDFNTYE